VKAVVGSESLVHTPLHPLAKKAWSTASSEATEPPGAVVEVGAGIDVGVLVVAPDPVGETCGVVPRVVDGAGRPVVEVELELDPPPHPAAESPAVARQAATITVRLHAIGPRG
jgi:hypothetical protein